MHRIQADVSACFWFLTVKIAPSSASGELSLSKGGVVELFLVDGQRSGRATAFGSGGQDFLSSVIT